MDTFALSFVEARIARSKLCHGISTLSYFDRNPEASSHDHVATECASCLEFGIWNLKYIEGTLVGFTHSHAMKSRVPYPRKLEFEIPSY